ncbi:zinc finger BED domain-containing protein RICESLEEPER 1-like [Panicum miliaceum]|uniref:Zinc finger BED domain-containing protein RICESLEEPER 1-like n=1 Tax=Panicum miliaceum TaxID=4540 RepID=A0A3L6RIA0_PANMI|nr:zinc finger BED domain-containing protein RICESLEEPER 1-like [Panicum miliaceum]
MIALHGYDPSFVEDDYFRSFVRRLNPEFDVPSRVAIEEMCDGIFDEARRDSFSRITSAPGRVSLAVGIAKTPEEGEVVIYRECHFIDDQWNLHKLVLDALVVAGDEERDSMNAPILGVHVFNGEGPYHVKLAISSEHRDRLFMVAYDITFPSGLKSYIDEDINSDANKLSCTTTTYVDNVLHSIARCLLPDADFTVDMFWEMKKLNLTRQERLQLLSELDLNLEWAFDESWCACYSSLQVLRKRGFTNQLVGLELCVELLCKVWGQVYRGIQTISASTSPTSNLCLAELLKLREILHSQLARVSGDDAEVQERYADYLYHNKELVVVLREVSDALDKAIQDSYLIWSVPLALDPRYKLGYIEFWFERAFGLEATNYVTEVKNKINKLYADYIKDYGRITDADHSDVANTTVAATSVHPWEQAWNERRRSQDVMAAQVNRVYPGTQTELDRYLRGPLAPQDFDVLNWWKENSGRYPMVARMARDALAMPTCSKLSSDQLAQVRSILRGYSKKPWGDRTFSSSSSSGGGDMIR